MKFLRAKENVDKLIGYVETLKQKGKKMNKNIIFEAIIGVIKLKLNSIFKKNE